jgi:serine/threonine-protein kinase
MARIAPLVAELDADDDFLAPAAGVRGPLFDALCRELAHATERTLLSPGDRLGPYLVGARVGRGGMGEVYRARDEQLGRDVALKVLPAEGADEDRLARLRREARLLAALNHPNIGAIYGLVSDEHASALVLEFVDGPTLADRLKDGPLPLDEVVTVARQLADALDAARARRIAHCDLKPANIAFARDGRVKVLDFGIATVWRSDPSVASASTSGSLALALADVPGTVIGTAAYMSPEQVRGDTVGHRTDVWAFGCVVFEMLTGTRAFGGDATADVLSRVLEGSPDFDRLPASTPPSLRRLVERCLERDLSRRLGRIADARPLLDAGALEAAAKAAPPAADRATRWRRRPVMLVGGLVLAALAGLASWFAALAGAH